MQGLQRGTRTRPGISLERKTAYCDICKKSTVWDRWTGAYHQSNAAAGIPRALMKRIFEHYDYTDAIEQRKRPAHELIADHRVPMERWGTAEESLSPATSKEEIERKFQVLKKDMSGNHNLLKSRACEACIKTGKRGFPLGIRFYYAGGEDWPTEAPVRGPGAEQGCIGCGWYDFTRWRISLNERLSS